MSRRRVALYEYEFHYEPALAVHTATSGRLTGLTSLFLVIDTGEGIVGLSELRINVEYLTGIAMPAMRAQALACVSALDWSAPIAQLAESLDADQDMASHLHTLLETALLDCLAKAGGRTLTGYLGGRDQARVATNQCLFWCERPDFERRAERFVAEGFHDLKVRAGIGAFAEDVARILWLRERFGEAIEIAVDINGTWSSATAIAFLRAIEQAAIGHIEQPTPAGETDALRAVLLEGGVPVMIDEGAASLADIEGLLEIGGPLMIHLKAVKLGGPSRLLRAAALLEQAGVPFMMGQMNEGAVATALAAHCALATGAGYHELYGAYGLVDDPAAGIGYRDGCLLLPQGPGLGVELRTDISNLIWEYRP